MDSGSILFSHLHANMESSQKWNNCYPAPPTCIDFYTIYKPNPDTCAFFSIYAPYIYAPKALNFILIIF